MRCGLIVACLMSFWIAWQFDASVAGSTNSTQPREERTGDPHENIATLEQQIATSTGKAKRSVVRIAWLNGRVKVEQCFSGVILTADGYVATCAYNPAYEMHDLPPGKVVSIHLSDGRCVPGVAVGSALQWGFGLVKITQDGQWPHVEIGRSSEIKLGELCFALGYPLATLSGSLPYDREPSLRIGHVVAKADLRWIEISCRLDGSSDRGSGLFDLQGRLIGVHQFPERQMSLHPTIEIIEQHWKELAGRKLPEEKSVHGQDQRTGEPAEKAELPLLPSPDDPNLAAAVAKAKQVTVRIDRLGEETGHSGVLVTPDGYVATCGHHGFAAGTAVTIRFADGRSAPGTIMGSDLLLDVGLAKITAPGPWPHAAWASGAGVKSGDLCLAAGYPLRPEQTVRQQLEVRVGRITSNMWLAPWQLESTCETYGGDSGGGLFDAKGRLIGVHKGGYAVAPTWHRTSDLFKQHWDFLVNDGPMLGDVAPFDLSQTAEAFRKAVEQVHPITVEVLSDEPVPGLEDGSRPAGPPGPAAAYERPDPNRRCLGTVVSSEGCVLTKASELYGRIACRLADGRVLPATVVNVSREHDLALLKIEATGLPQIRWSGRQQIPVGSFVGAMRYQEPPVVGIVALATHYVPRAAGYLVFGEVKDGKDGVEVTKLRGIWEYPGEMHKGKEGPLRKGDVILHVEGHLTPDLKTFEAVTKHEGPSWEVPFVIAGDPIRVGVKRDGKDLELRYPLLSAISDPLGGTSLRKCAFPSVFDTDTIITRNSCGGPLVDRSGEVVGITIALPTPYRVYVIPAGIAFKVANELKRTGPK